MDLSPEYYYSIAGTFSFVAYLLGSMLWLRVLLVIAAVIYIISGVMLGVTSMVGWNFAYLIVNLFHIFFLLLDRSTISLPEETTSIYSKYFSAMSTREFKKVITLNPFIDVENQTLIESGEITDSLFIILSGDINIIVNEAITATLTTGDLVGEMSFMSKEPAYAKAVANGEVRYAYWTHVDLENIKKKKIDTYNKFISIVGCDLVRKLKQKSIPISR